ncbi:hypothetical protein [Pelagibacterium halotolerans]|uniref:Uncharacterized protein n=1 Tax=Pelagibacterium halotolerans (strain DSM 22347 / JCM 15775 / CGMCC 1.7692 / B2) TaxID=1082931 RepID=G4RDS6_PELHB|nr:hypothetical protein [Pelagibacterium halotolerans]AEQ52862.1 hypothetical protein KKY_2857 [Pelagibacterium halotolerans B2]QJR17458.1 hypothetical protein HKM20_02755 [Pelagibacterium halotolerans]
MNDNIDDRYSPENMSDDDLIKAYVALSRSSITANSKWVETLRKEIAKRALQIPNQHP